MNFNFYVENFLKIKLSIHISIFKKFYRDDKESHVRHNSSVE